MPKPQRPAEGWDSDALDQATIDAIIQLTAERNFPPSFREIGERTGRGSTGTVKRRIDRLARLGYITYDPKSPRTIVVTRNPGMKTETENMA